MAARADAEMMVRRRDPQVGQDLVRHVGIVMLTGVNEDRLEILRGGQRVEKRGHLHEVGPGGGDQMDAGGRHAFPFR
jgi:hypothetical protein